MSMKDYRANLLKKMNSALNSGKSKAAISYMATLLDTIYPALDTEKEAEELKDFVKEKWREYDDTIDEAEKKASESMTVSKGMKLRSDGYRGAREKLVLEIRERLTDLLIRKNLVPQ